MRHFALLIPILLLSGCGHAGEYLIEAAPEPASMGHSTERLFVVPFKDVRGSREIYKGRSGWETVFVDSAGNSTLAGAWSGLKKGDVSYLWHRQLAYGLNEGGYFATGAAVPMPEHEQEAAALEACSSLVIDGQIKKLFVDKRGADDFFGTNFSGTNYHFKSEASVRVRSAETGKVLLNKDFVYTHTFLNKQMLGADDKATFPIFFATGIELAVKGLGEDSELRVLVGLPTVTPTPSPTRTLEAGKITPQATPGSILPTPTATPDLAPYWVNPKTGKRMDPSWKFDPEDGTPSSKFMLRTPKGKKP